MSPEQLQHMRAHARSYTERQHEARTTIAIVGLGYVGLPLAILAAQKGFSVVGFDIDEVKVAQLQRRETNFLTDEEVEEFKRSRRLSITASESDLQNARTVIICVPTPVHDNHSPDLGPLKSAATIVGRNLARDSLVIVESTVSPGVCEEVVLSILEEESGLTRDEFFFAHCPERINPGDEEFSVRTIPRVVGGISPESLRRATEIYRAIIDADIIPMETIKEAEAAKMVENSFRDINIAFVNELAMAFDRAGIDIVNVIRAASTKPFGFMAHYPGCGVGGHCIPVDPYYLIRYGKRNGFEHRFLMTARRINSGMPRYTVQVLANALLKKKKRLPGSVVALLGLSYKRDIPDIRESPGVEIRDQLLREGATVRTFDPHALSLSSVRTLEDALDKADAAVVATDHTAFRGLRPEHFEVCGVDTVIDGRNCLPKDLFRTSSVQYRGIGR